MNNGKDKLWNNYEKDEHIDINPNYFTFFLNLLFNCSLSSDISILSNIEEILVYLKYKFITIN